MTVRLSRIDSELNRAPAPSGSIAAGCPNIRAGCHAVRPNSRFGEERSAGDHAAVVAAAGGSRTRFANQCAAFCLSPCPIVLPLWQFRLATLTTMRGASSRPPGPNGDDRALERFPLAASETMMLRFRRSQSNPERYRIYFKRQGSGLTDQDSIGPKIGRGSSSSQHQKPRSAIGRAPVDFSKWPLTLSSSG